MDFWIEKSPLRIATYCEMWSHLHLRHYEFYSDLCLNLMNHSCLYESQCSLCDKLGVGSLVGRATKENDDD